MLIGRDDELDELHRSLRGGLVAVVGAPGIGKSVLARAAARDAVIVDCSGAPSGDALVQRLAASLSLPDGPARESRLVHVLADRAVVLFDDVDGAEDAAAALAERWLSLVPGLTILATSRRPVPRADAVMELGPLAPDAGARLLAASAGPRQRLDPEAPALRDLAEALDGHPLALVLAGERLRFLTPEQLQDADAPTRLLGGSLATSIDRALLSLSPAGRDGLGRLALFAGPFRLDDALALLVDAPMDALQELRDGSLLEADGPLLRVLRPIRERAPAPDETAHAAHAQAVLAALDRSERPHPDDVVAALSHLEGPALADRIVTAPVRRLLSPRQRIAALDRSERSPECSLALARLLADTGQLARARKRCAPIVGSLRAEALALLAHVELRAGAPEAAADALAEARTLDPPSATAARLHMEEALLAHERGAPGDGLAPLTAAEAGFAAVRDEEGAARAALRRGLLELAAGHVSDGVPTLLRAELALESAGLADLAATAACYLALVSLEVGDDVAARDHLERAAARWDRSGDVLGLARVAGLRGVLAMLAGDLRAARPLLDEASLADEPRDRPRWSVLLLEARAILAARSGRLPEARLLCDRALALARPLPKRSRDGLQRTRHAIDTGRDAVPDLSLRGRLLASLAARPQSAPLPRLIADADGSWFSLGNEGVDLSRRGAPRRILAALLDAAQDEEDLDIHAIVAAGWPDETLHPEAGRARAYTAIRSLRRFGLENVLVTRDTGYRLEADITLRG